MQASQNENQSQNSRRNRNRGRNSHHSRYSRQSSHEAEITSQITQSFRPYQNSFIDTSVPPPENSRGAIIQNTYFPNSGF